VKILIICHIRRFAADNATAFPKVCRKPSSWNDHTEIIGKTKTKQVRNYNSFVVAVRVTVWAAPEIWVQRAKEARAGHDNVERIALKILEISAGAVGVEMRRARGAATPPNPLA
jgi:hypothetical protein